MLANEVMQTVVVRLVRLAWLCIFFSFGIAPAADFFAAPDGSASGDGSRERPWDLKTALAANANANSPNHVIKGGDTLWLLGGTYQGAFTSYLTGQEGEPICVRSRLEDRAIIDGAISQLNTFTISGAWTDYRDFEVLNSTLERTNARPTGVNIFGPNTRAINLVVHDAGVGVGFWEEATNSEVTGCIIYNNGWQGAPPDRGHGHAIYVQNNSGTKRIRHNILFNQFGMGLHAYGKAGGLVGLHVEGNVSFNNGSIQREQDRQDNILIGGYQPAGQILVTNNFTYFNFRGSSNERFGYSLITISNTAHLNTDITVRSNVFVGGGAHRFHYWTNLIVLDNTFYSIAGDLNVDPGPEAVLWQFDRNRYYLGGRFVFRSTAYSFSDWKTVTGCDQASTYTSSRPTGVWKYVSRNPDDAYRANIVIYNWDLADYVDVDVGSLLATGVPYEVRNAQDFFGRTVVSGTWSGGVIRIPMTGLSVTKAIGTEAHPGPTGPEFNVFVLVRKLSPVEGLRFVP